jgi:hypothetical protein
MAAAGGGENKGDTKRVEAAPPTYDQMVFEGQWEQLLRWAEQRELEVIIILIIIILPILILQHLSILSFLHYICTA